jgi:hypothetical protein
LKLAIAQKTEGFRAIAKQAVEMLRVFQQPASGPGGKKKMFPAGGEVL